MSLTSCTGYPVYEFGLPCHDVFKWRTKLVCPDAQVSSLQLNSILLTFHNQESVKKCVFKKKMS